MSKFIFAVFCLFCISPHVFVWGWVFKDCSLNEDWFTMDVEQSPGDFSNNFSSVSCGKPDSYQHELKGVAADLVGLSVAVSVLRPGGFSQFYNLKRLSLNITKGTVIHSGAFQGLTVLESLTLSFDGLLNESIIEEGAFESLDTLKKLHLYFYTVRTYNVSVRTCVKSRCEVICRVTKYVSQSHFEADFGDMDRIRRNCTTAPLRTAGISLPGVQLYLRDLILSWNFIPRVDSAYLFNSTHLVSLSLDLLLFDLSELMESRLKTIDRLSLSGNQEQEYGFMKTVCQVVSNFRVKHLTANYRGVHNISNEIFAGCRQLESLDVSGCEISSSESGFLYSMKNLTRLDMQRNGLKIINICPVNKTFITRLTYLDLFENDINELKSGQFSCMTYLRYLNLTYNKVETIGEFAFHGLEQLTELSMNYNKIQVLEKKQFDNLKSLSTLSLLNNKIKIISQGALKDLPLQKLSLGNLKNGLHLNLSDFPSGIRTLYLQTKGEEDIMLHHTFHLRSLENLYLFGSGSLFWFEDFESASIVTTLKELHLKMAIPFCDYMRFTELTNLEKLYLRNNDRTYNTLPELATLQKLKVLYLEDTVGMIYTAGERSELLFRNLTSLKYLMLINSGISHFTALMFQDLVSLEVFIVQRQNILILESRLFQNSINLNYILFDKAVLQCACHNAWIIPWAATKRNMLLNFAKVKCSMLPSYITSFFVTFVEHVCNYSFEFTYFIVTTAFLLLFLVFTFVYLKAGWFIIYVLYRLRGHLARLTGKVSNNMQYNYDVFVSYSSKDEPWVVAELLPNLEQKGPPFLKACLHNRDFEVGKDIVDNIVDSIYSSRKTICVISRNFLRSEWCSLEMRMATFRLLAESQDLLILVFLERISLHEISAYDRLARMIKKKTYIDWPEGGNEKQLFWERLKRTLMETKNDKSIQI